MPGKVAREAAHRLSGATVRAVRDEIGGQAAAAEAAAVVGAARTATGRDRHFDEMSAIVVEEIGETEVDEAATIGEAASDPTSTTAIAHHPKALASAYPRRAIRPFSLLAGPPSLLPAPAPLPTL